MQSTAQNGSAGFGVFALIIGLLLIVGVLVKVYDLRRRREADAVHLQAQVSDALLRDESLLGLAVTPTAHVPMWGKRPATIEMRGRVPTPELKAAALRTAEGEARRVRPDVEIVDRLAVDALAQRAA